MEQMFSVVIWLLTHSMLPALRLSSPGSFPRPLSASEEAAYLARSEQGDEQARGVLIEHNLRLVSHIVKKYYTQSGEQDDLVSIGTIGLIKGVTSYRADKGTRLATYAARCIENEILMYFRSRRKVQGEVSLSESIDADKDGNALYLMDIVSTDEDLYEELSVREDRLLIRRLVRECLTEREQEVICARYGLGGREEMTQRDVAARLGISRSYVSRIEKRALEKLEAALEGHT